MVKKLFVFVPILLEDLGDAFKGLFAVVVGFGKFFGDVGNRGVYEFAKKSFEVGGKIFDERGWRGTMPKSRIQAASHTTAQKTS